MSTPAASAGFSFLGSLRPDDWIVCGQAASEPVTLMRQLAADLRQAPMPVTLFVGTCLPGSLATAMPDGTRFASYGAMGSAATLSDRGLLDVVPERYSELHTAFECGALRADVVLLQVAPGRDGHRPSLGLTNDYTLAAASRARLVIAEINPQVPWTFGAELPDTLRIDHWVTSSAPPLELSAPLEGAVERAIASHVAQVVPDEATLQMGIGSLPDAALRQLAGRRRLGIHSGVLGDAALSLIEQGVVTNSHKGIDVGVSITNTLIGSAALYRWCDRNPQVQVRPAGYTHDARVLARVSKLQAINSALQVDLTGQVNCEAVGSKHRGGVGGLADFACAARHASPGGRGIIVMPATAEGGTRSRIVASIASDPVTIGRADVDTIITEYGVADLRYATLEQRARRLIAIAAPALRAELESAWRDSIWGRKAWH
ncbi:acetyl-CoA hydrolase/transferase C-terminal domain-containing protein [soil metagenome]